MTNIQRRFLLPSSWLPQQNLFCAIINKKEKRNESKWSGRERGQLLSLSLSLSALRSLGANLQAKESIEEGAHLLTIYSTGFGMQFCSKEFSTEQAQMPLTSTLLKQMCNLVARTSFATQAASEESFVFPLISLLLKFMQEN
jgi:hypothetical protein